jgi:zinc D-Ala-D-Ala carboxypeptidase
MRLILAPAAADTLSLVPSRPRHRRLSALVAVLSAVLLMSGCSAAAERPVDPIAVTSTTIPAPVQSVEATPPPAPEFDRRALSIDDPASLWVVVNKRRPLAQLDHVPADLRRVDIPYVYEPLLRAEAAAAAEQLVAAARAEGIQVQSQSAYRSYDSQVRINAETVARLGQAAADLTSARPGHSEHQTGLAIDFSSSQVGCALEQCFAETAPGRWLAENAWRFGFHLRYPEGKTAITGYVFEPWHFRYVGAALAAELRETGILTLEEFFGLPPAPDYAT